MNLVHSSTLGDGGAFESCLDFSPPPDRQGSSRTPWAPPHVPKRSKVSLACHTCRRRKKRCDGLWPSCTPCKRRPDGWKCQYPEKTITGKATIPTSLQFPRPDFEAASRGQSRPLPAVVLATNKPSKRPRQDFNPPPSDGPVPSRFDFAAELGNLSTSTLPVGDPLAQVRPDRSHKSLVGVSCLKSHSVQPVLEMRSVYSTDAMAVVFTATYDGSGFYGSSSTVAFLDSVIQTAEQGDQIHEDVSPIQQSECLTSREPTKVFRGANDDAMGPNDGGLVLPGKRLADALLQCFWDVVHPLFPVLHRRSFLEAYDALWMRHAQPADSEGSQEDEESNSYCMVNIVLALGAQFNQEFSPAQRARASDEFFQRSRRLLALDALDTSSFSAVQTLVLTGIYLQSTKHANQCWNVVGLAIRAAQGLGLHLNDGPYSIPADGSVEADMNWQMRSRVWCCCLILDRLVSMTFGRPFMISNHSSNTMPALTDEEGDSEDGQVLARDYVPPYGCFVYSLQLFDILEDILSALYAGVTVPLRARGESATRPNVPDLTKVVELDARLNDFHRDLPSFLKPREWSPLASDSATLQANVLQVRFFHTRILLLRPVLLVLMRTESGRVEDDQTMFRTALLREMSLRMSEACIITAHEMIEFLHQRLDTVYRSACWYMVYFTFTSATVLIAAKLCPSLRVTSESSRFQASWTKCQAILEYHKSQSQSASRGQQILRALDDRVSSLLTRSTVATSSAKQYSGDAGVTNPTGSTSSGFFKGFAQDKSRRDSFSEDWLLNDFATNLDFLDL